MLQRSTVIRHLPARAQPAALQPCIRLPGIAPFTAARAVATSSSPQANATSRRTLVQNIVSGFVLGSSMAMLPGGSRSVASAASAGSEIEKVGEALPGNVRGTYPLQRPPLAQPLSRSCGVTLQVLEDPRWPEAWPFKPDDFGRYDESPDTVFYSSPRLVYHIDDKAVGALTK